MKLPFPPLPPRGPPPLSGPALGIPPPRFRGIPPYPGIAPIEPGKRRKSEHVGQNKKRRRGDRAKKPFGCIGALEYGFAGSLRSSLLLIGPPAPPTEEVPDEEPEEEPEEEEDTLSNIGIEPCFKLAAVAKFTISVLPCNSFVASFSFAIAAISADVNSTRAYLEMERR